MSTTAASIEADDLGGRRRRAGLSQQQLAAAADCSISLIRLFEGGYQPHESPTRERILAILDELEAEQTGP